MGFLYLDTGALYRAVGLYVCEKKIGSAETGKIEECIDAANIKIELTYADGIQRVFLNGEDVSEKIRENHISKYASDVSKINKVREFLLRLQKDTAENNNVVMEGRDIATVIMPDADLKIFLTASPEKRAERRYKELTEKGYKDINYEKILKEITERDAQDSNRDVAPLKPAPGAVVIDNSDCESHCGTLEMALKIIKEKLPYVCIR